MKAQEILTRLKEQEPEYVAGALIAIYQGQTMDEQDQRATSYRNGVGFNALDAGICSDIAQRFERYKRLTPKQIAFLSKILQKYVRQLEGMGDLFHPVPVNVGAPKTQQTARTARLNGKKIELRFAFDRSLIAQVKELPFRRFGGKEKGDPHWTTPVCLETVEKIQTWGFDIDPEIMDWYRSVTMTQEDFAKERVEVPGLKGTLRPYQEAAVAMARAKNYRLLNADDMGLGKTIETIAMILDIESKTKYEGNHIVVCPASVKYNWRKEILKWSDLTVHVIEGWGTEDSVLPDADVYVLNWNLLAPIYDTSSKTNKAGKKLPIEQWKVIHPGWTRLLRKNVSILSVTLDESHYMRKRDSLRSQFAHELCKGVEHILSLTGTPVENKAIDFFSTFRLLEPGIFPSFMDYAVECCGSYHNGWGWVHGKPKWTQEEERKALGKLHERAKSIMIRRLKEEVLPDLPKKQRIVIPLRMNDADRKQYLKEEQTVLDNNEFLSARTKLKQLAVNAVLDQSIEWIEDYLYSGKKLVVFCHHKKVVNALMKKFKKIAVKVDGSVKGIPRQEAVDRFQEDEEIRLFVGTKAACEGITLTASSATCTLELWDIPEAHKQAEDRVLRIGQAAQSVEAYYLMAEGTIMEDMAEMLDYKGDTISQVTDGRIMKEKDKLHYLMEQVKKRHEEVV